MSEQSASGNGSYAEHLQSLAENLQSLLQQARRELADWDGEAQNFFKQRPLVTVLAAVAVGYLFARLVARA